MPIEADIVDTEAIRIRLLLWRLLWVEAVALGTANMVTINDDEEVGTAAFELEVVVKSTTVADVKTTWELMLKANTMRLWCSIMLN